MFPDILCFLIFSSVIHTVTNVALNAEHSAQLSTACGTTANWYEWQFLMQSASTVYAYYLLIGKDSKQMNMIKYSIRVRMLKSPEQHLATPYLFQKNR